MKEDWNKVEYSMGRGWDKRGNQRWEGGNGNGEREIKLAACLLPKVANAKG